MSYVRLETQGESHVAIINTEHVTFLAEGIYGTAVHFVSGESLICVGELGELATRLFGIGADAPGAATNDAQSYLIAENNRAE